MKTNEIIPPHGNSLINCFAQNPAEVLKEAREFTSVIVSKRVLCDLEMLAIGAFSPLNGFTGKKDYESIIESMRLSNGLIWPIPITLQVNKETYEKVKNQNKIALKDESDEIVAVLNLKEIYQPDLKKEAELVFKTLDTNHPAVKYLFEAGEYYLAGDVKVLKSTYDEFPEYNLGCTKTREIFSEKG